MIAGSTYSVLYDTAFGEIAESVSLSGVEDKNSDVTKSIAKILNIQESQIIKFNKLLGSPDPEIKEQDLTLVLTSIYSAVISGQNVIDVLLDLLDDLYKNKKLNRKMIFFKKQGLTIAEIFKRLNVDVAICAMIDAGVTNGSLPSSLLDARKFLSMSAEIKKSVKTGIGQTVFYLITGIVLVFIMPYVVAGFFNEMLEMVDPQTSKPTSLLYLNFMKDTFVFNIIILVIAVLGIATILLNKQLFKLASNVPLFSNLYFISKNKEAINFLLFYITLNKVGINDERIINLHKPMNKDLSDRLLQEIKKGLSLSYGFNNVDLPKRVANSISTIIDIRDLEVKDQAFGGVIDSLIHSSMSSARKFSAILNLTSLIFVAFGILAIIIPYQAVLQASLGAI